MHPILNSKNRIILLLLVIVSTVVFLHLASDSSTFLSIPKDESIIDFTTTKWITEDDAKIQNHDFTFAKPTLSASTKTKEALPNTFFNNSPPLDYRMLGHPPLSASAFPNNPKSKLFLNSSEIGGFRNLVSSKKSWLFVKKRDALMWFEKKYRRPGAECSWSCGVGRVDKKRSNRETARSHEVKIWKNMPLLFHEFYLPAKNTNNERPNKTVTNAMMSSNISKMLGKGWEPFETPQLRHLTASLAQSTVSTCESRIKKSRFLEAKEQQRIAREEQRALLEQLKPNEVLVMEFANDFIKGLEEMIERVSKYHSSARQQNSNSNDDGSSIQNNTGSNFSKTKNHHHGQDEIDSAIGIVYVSGLPQSANVATAKIIRNWFKAQQRIANIRWLQNETHLELEKKKIGILQSSGSGSNQNNNTNDNNTSSAKSNNYVFNQIIHPKFLALYETWISRQDKFKDFFTLITTSVGAVPADKQLSSIPPPTKEDFGINSVSVNQLRDGCMDDIIAIDGRAPSFAHAMSRRCLDPFALAKQKLFFLGIGHSHTRYLFGMLCMLGNHRWCEDFSAHHFHVPVYPVDALSRRWWEGQELLTRVNDDKNNGNTKHSNGVHFRLLYSAAWYDPREALIRSLQSLILLPASMNNTSTRHDRFPEAPNITLFFTEDFGLKQHKQLMAKWDRELDRWITAIKPHLALIPTHFVVSRGEWDFHFMSPKLSAIVEQTANLLSIIHRHFPESVIFLQLPQHHQHIRFLQQMARFRAVCASQERVEWLRQVNICAAYETYQRTLLLEQNGNHPVNDNNNNNNDEPKSVPGKKRNSFLSKLVIFDSDNVAKSWMGNVFVDPAGHHYSDVALEVLALEMRLIASNPVIQRLYQLRAWTKYFGNSETAKMCKKIQDLDLDEGANGRKMNNKKKNEKWDNEQFIWKYNTSSQTVHANNVTQFLADTSKLIPTNSTKNLNRVYSNQNYYDFYEPATNLLFELPLSLNDGYPAERRSKELICTCHRDDIGDSEGVKHELSAQEQKSHELQRILCDSVRVPPKQFTKI